MSTLGKKELQRHALSLGVFYVVFPTLWLISGFLYGHFIPLSPIASLGVFVFPLAALILLLGATLSYKSYRDQLKIGRGHPFAFSGDSDLSRPTQKLLTSGVYFWSRNPMNLGDMLLYVGLSLITQCDGGLLVNTPLYVLVVWGNSRLLERKGLVQRFGDQYLEYERTTSTFVPGFKTWRKVIAARKGPDH